MNPTITLSISQLQRLHRGRTYGLTDIGPVRKANEDNFLIDANLDLVMVADGMGGHAAGADASALTLLSIRDFLLQPPQRLLAAPQGGDATQDPDATCSNKRLTVVSLLFDAVNWANQAVYAQNLALQRVQGGMGTTLSGFWYSTFADEWVFFHVGDSRLYRLRDGELQQLTRDQTLYQQALEAGELETCRRATYYCKPWARPPKCSRRCAR